MFGATTVRADIAHAVSVLSRCLANPTQKSWKAAVRVEDLQSSVSLDLGNSYFLRCLVEDLQSSVSLDLGNSYFLLFLYT
jgi:hypothetical protein